MNKIEGNIGGGAASALSGSMAANIINMVARLSKGKNFGLEDEEYEAIEIKANKIFHELQEGALRDDQAYGLIASAYKLPKLTDEEKKLRQMAISDGAYQAALIPAKNALKSASVREMARTLDGRSNPNTYTDLYCAIKLSDLAVEGLIMNIEINMPLIKDESKIEELKKIIVDLKSHKECL